MTALAFAPTTPRRRSIRRVLLATDLSPASAEAAETALELASRLGASLVAISVIDPGTSVPGIGGPRVDQVRSQRELAAQELVARGRALGVAVTFLIWQGEPGESIVEAATAEEADLIVVGSHGRGSVGRFLIGSVSDHVVRNADCPVIVVRARSAG
jgi:nucleotide-binding universal stress UspA family protein